MERRDCVCRLENPNLSEIIILSKIIYRFIAILAKFHQAFTFCFDKRIPTSNGFAKDLEEPTEF